MLETIDLDSIFLFLDSSFRIYFPWILIRGSYFLWKCHTIINIYMIFYQNGKLFVLGVSIYKKEIIVAF